MPPRPSRPDATDQRAESIGALLTRLRHTRGFSQLRLAELLCAAANLPTVSRHEVSRWEREERVPGGYWLGWLAAVLEVPLQQLEAAAAQARRRPPAGPPDGPGATSGSLWRPASAAELLIALDHGGGDLRELAHLWLAGPLDPPAPRDVAPDGPPQRAAARHGPPADPVPIEQLQRRLRRLRRTDDLVGGADLAHRAAADLRTVLGQLGSRPGRLRREALRLAAGFAQLSGWVHADGGDPVAARRAYGVALRAATAGADRALAAHVLGSVSHLLLTTGDPHQALLLARTAAAGAGRGGSTLVRALLQHRVALAAAEAGERRAAHLALADAHRLAERADRGREPAWLYWLDEAELVAMTGRCLAALGRPLRAEAALRRAATRRGAGPRARALYAGWLARAYLALGEVEQACAVAAGALLDAVRAGSVRAATGVRRWERELPRRAEDEPAVRGFRALAAAAAHHLPGPPGQRPAGQRPAGQRRRSA